MKRLRVAAMLAVSVLAGCEEEGANISGVAGYNIRNVRVSPSLDTIFVPDTIRATDRATFVAVAVSKTGAPMPVMTFAWRSSDETIATVDSTGVVTPRTYGTVQIEASAAKIGRATLVVLPLPSTLTVTPALDSIYVEEPIATLRDTLRLRAASHDALGQPLTGIAYRWQSSAPGTVTVDGTGLVRAVGLGSATISVTTEADFEQVTVRVVPVVASVQVASPVTQVLALDTVQLTAAARGYDGVSMARSYTWTSSNPAVASVNASGAVIFHGTGSATVTARTAFRTSSVEITALPRQLLSVDAGEEYTCGLTSLGRGYCWGYAFAGRTGSPADSVCFREVPVGAGECTLLPKRMLRPELSFSTLSAGQTFGCGIEVSGYLYCWGNGIDGRLGNGSAVSSVSPALATVKTERFRAVSAGGTHACALNLAGVAYCWGNDSNGQLGDRRRIHSTTPIPVADTTLQFTSITAGGQHTCAIATGGAAYCWGNGSRGQLGHSGTADADVPTVVAGGHTFVAISAGEAHTCAIDDTAALYCWGENANAQLGLGVIGGTRLEPTLVPGSGSFTAVSAGAVHTCGIAAGQATCWGRSDWGQVGDGDLSTHTVPSPTAVAGGFAASAITAGLSHTCAIASGTGLTWCWGSNRWGALGNEYQAAHRATPQLVARPR